MLSILSLFKIISLKAYAITLNAWKFGRNAAIQASLSGYWLTIYPQKADD